MKVKLNETGKIITGNTPKTSEVENYSSNDIPFIKPSDILEDDIVSIRKSEFWISDHARKKARILPPNSVLVTCIGIIGKVAINTCECAFNQQINAIIPDLERYLPEYLAYAILAKQKYLQDIANAPVVPIINKSQFADIDIQTNDIQTQKRVVDKLSHVSELIKFNNYRLNKFDELVKSRFMEMFGDPVLNLPKWDKVPMGNYMSILTDFSANGSYEYLDSNVVMYNEPNYALMVRTIDLERNDFKNDVKYIDEKAYNILSKSKLFGNEIIMNKIGSAGKVYLMPKLSRPASLGRNAFMFRFNSDINIIFLYYLLTSEYGLSEIQQHVRGAVTKTITKDAARSIRIIVPPVELQNQFADFVAQVEKQKATVKKSIEKLETLKKSLMQDYFG